MGEGTDEEKSDVPDTDDEQTGDGEDKKAPVTEKEEEQTPAGDESGDNQDASDENAAGSDEEPTEENKPADEEEFDKITVNGSEVNAVTPAATTITVEQYEKDGTPAAAEGGQATDKKLDGDAAAEVTFVDGTNADDSKALGGDRPVTFLVDAKDGWKKSFAVSYTIAKGGAVTEDKTDTITANSNGEFVVPTNVAAVTGENATPAGYSGNITIKITAVPVKSTVKLSAAAGSGVTVVLAKADGTPDTEKAITNAAGQELTYAASTTDVTLAVTGLTKKYNTIDVAANSGDTSTIKASGTKTVGTGEEAKTYYLFTFDPSALDGFEDNDDNDVAVTLGEGAEAHGLTLALDAKKGTDWTAAAVTPAESATEDYITINNGGSAFDVTAIADGLNEDNYAKVSDEANAKKRVLAFKVTAGTALKLKGDKPVKAVLTADDDASDPKTAVQTLDATAVPESAAGKDDGYYKIDLSALTKANFTGAMTLTIMVETEIDTTATGVHRIEFKGAENVTLGKKNSKNTFDELASSYTAKMDDITFGVKPNAGYSLAKGTDYSDDGTSDMPVVTVSYDKVYALKTTDTEAKDVTVKIPVTGEELPVRADSDDADYFAAAFKFTEAGYKDAAWKNGLPSGTTADKISVGENNSDGNMAFTKENVVVTVKTELESGKSGYVTIDSEDADYEVSGDGITKSIGDSYWISEEATLLTLTITSDVEPSVTFNESNSGRAEVKAGEAEGTYVAEIPVSELAAADETIDDSIVISKGTKTLTVESTLDGEDENAFNGEIWVNDREFENGDPLTSGMKADVTINAPVGTELVSVAKVVGDDGEEEAVELGEDKGSVTFPVTMTGDITVKVALKSVYDAVVEVGGAKAERGDDGVYIIPAGSSSITVSLYKGEDTAADILYAKVYDGNEIAITKATVNTNVATIAKIDENDTGVLRVELAAKATKKVEASVEIKQEQAASELAIKDAKNRAVSSVSLMADGPAAEFTVSAASGRLDYAESNIGLEVVAKADDAPAATLATSNDFVTAAYAGGKLTITAKPAKEGKEAAAVIRFYDKAKREAATGDADKLCLMAPAITVNTTNPSVVGQKPTVKEANGSEKDKKLWVELSTSDKVVKPASDNKVFYKVTVEGILAGTLAEADKTQYIEKTAWGKDSQIAGIVVDNTPDADGKRVEGSAKDYALKVELVQTTAVPAGTAASAVTAATAATEAANSTLALGGQVAELKKISTRDPLYETKLKMKPASVTVYTGQTLASAKQKPQTQAQFDKKTGYTVVPYVQFVNTRTGVLQGTSSRTNGTATSGGWSAAVDANGNVAIGYTGRANAAKNLPKDIGLKVTAEYPEGAYAATAIVKITVVNGIEDINFVSGDYRSIYKQSGKPASLKLTPILNWGYKDQAPKKKTLTYAMGDAEGNLPGDGGYSLNPEVAAKVKVNPKNGAVTVDKNYDVTKGNTFTVVAKAADYEGNKETGTVYVDITSQPQALGEVVIVETDDWESYKVVARNNGTLNAEDFFTYNGYDVEFKWLGVKALKPTAGTKRVYTSDDFVWGVSYASSAKAALSTDTDDGYLRFIKPNAKPVKLTITPADGSGTKGKKEMSVTVKGFEKLGLEMYDSNGIHYDAREEEHTYDGAMNEKFRLIPVAEMWDDFYKDCDGLEYSNLTVTMKGAKATQKYNGIPTEIVMTAPTATVTIADKTEKSVKTIYTIKQDPAADTKAKAPSIKQIGKLTAADVEAVRNYDMDGEDLVKFQVTNKNTDPANHARQYVFLTPDYTKTKYVSGQGYEYDRADKYFLNYAGTVIKQIDDNGRFALDLNYVAGSDTFEVIPGTYTLIATVGNYSDGKFVPAAKGVNLKINIPGKAAKNNLTVKGKYTLDASAMAPVDLASGKNIVTDYHWTLTNAKDTNNNYAMNKIDPKTGKPNSFTTFFEVKKAGGSFTLGLRPNLTKAQIEYITGQVKETAKDAKADCEGYVTVSSYMYDEDSHQITKDMKITVSFKDAKYVAKTAEPSVYVGADATVQIFETAKSTDPIALAGAFIVADDKNGGAALVNTVSGVEADNESLKVKLSSAEAGKSYKVTLKVLAADSAYANMAAEGAKDYKKLAEDYGRTVTATIKVSGKDDKTKNKVAVTGKAFKITADDFVAAQTPTAVNGEYKLVIPVRSAIEGTQITAAAVPATVKDKDYEGKDIVSAAYAAQTGELTLTVKRDKLIEANAAKGGKFKFGKAVDVPVTFTFTDTAVTPETVNLKVTLPNPMTFEKAVEAATKLEDVIGVMNDDLLFNFEDGEESPADAAAMKDELAARIKAAINSAIPKDAQAAKVTRDDLTLTDVAKTETTPDGYKTTVSVWKGATKADGDYEHEYTFTKGEAFDATVSSLVIAIGNLTASDLAQLDNDYTPTKLLADVKAALAEDEVKIPANLSLSVVGWNLKKATATNDGNLSAAIHVRDRNDVSAPTYEDGTWSEDVAVMSSLSIEALGTLADAKTAVAAAVEEKSDDTGIDYNAVISDALTDTGAKTNVEAALKKAIEDAAKAAIKNPAIKVKGFEKIEKGAKSDNPTTATAPAKAMVDVDFMIPAGSTDGSVSFKLVLEQEGMKDLVVDCTATNAITVTAKTFTVMTVTGQDISGEAPANLTISSGKVAIADVDGAKSLKFTAAVTGTQLTAKDKEVTFSLVTGATAPDGDDKTQDDIPAATAPAGVTFTTNTDGTVTINVAANATWGGDDSDTITLYLRAQKKLKKLYTSDEDEIDVEDRTKVITIELKKKAAAATP